MEGDIRNALTRIEGTLRRHTQLLEDIMSGEDDLKQAIIDNAAAMTTAAKQIAADAAQLASVALGDADGDIETLAQQLKANTAQFNLAVANASAPAPAPAQNTGGAATPAQAPAPAPAQTTAQAPAPAPAQTTAQGTGTA